MVDPNVITAKLAELESRITRARRHCPPDPASLAVDDDALDLVAFNLMLAVQARLDVASHVIADEGWAPATELAGAFRRLHEHGILRESTAQALGRAAGLRNVIAHVYAKADPGLVWAGATGGLEDLEQFAAEIAAWLGAGRGVPS